MRRFTAVVIIPISVIGCIYVYSLIIKFIFMESIISAFEDTGSTSLYAYSFIPIFLGILKIVKLSRYLYPSRKGTRYVVFGIVFALAGISIYVIGHYILHQIGEFYTLYWIYIAVTGLFLLISGYGIEKIIDL